MKCLICARELNSELQPVPPDDLVAIRLLYQLLKILNLSTNICRFLVGTSLPTVVYCSSCEEVVTNCVKLSEEIELLRDSFEKLTSKVKEGFIEGYYCRPDVDDGGDEKAKAGAHIRKTLVQCWITCRVPINKLFENTPHVLIPFAKSPAVEQNLDLEAEYNGDLKSTTPNIYDDKDDHDNGNDHCGEIPPSPSPLHSYTENINANFEVDPFILKLGSPTQEVDRSDKNIETEVKLPPASNINIDLNSESTVVESKEKSSPRRSLRRRPQKKPKFVIQVNGSTSETDLITPLEAESDIEVEDFIETLKDSRRLVKRKRKKSPRNKFQPNSALEQIADDSNRSDLSVNILARENDSSESINTTDVGSLLRAFESQPQVVGRSNKNPKTEKDSSLNPQDAVKNEETSSRSSLRRSLRQRPQKKTMYTIESDDNASETDSIYSPEGEPGLDGDFVDRKDSSKIVKRKLRQSSRNKLPHTKSKQSQLKFPYNCKVCGHGYFSQYFLSLHEKNHIQGDLEFACTICDKSFNAHLKLTHHYSSFHKIRKGALNELRTGLESFHCTYCDKVYKSETFKIEAGSDKLKIHCDQTGCEKIFSSFLMFSYHHDKTCLDKIELIAEDKSKDLGKKGILRTYSSKPKASPAQLIDVSKIAKDALQTQTSLNTKLSHRGKVLMYPYRCEICGKHIMYLGSFLAHQKTHRREFDHSCTKCDKKFSSLFRLKLHYLKGHKIKFSIPYSTHACRYCGKICDVKFVDEKDSGKSGYLCAFKDCKFIAPTGARYRIHHADHHRRITRGKSDDEMLVSFRCKYCNKLYTYEEVTSSAENGQVVFNCTFDENCKEICSSMQSLSDHHICVHHGVNTLMKMCNRDKFLCKTCGKVFRTYEGCENHTISAHTKAFKYFCEICGKGCPSSSMYNAHIIAHSTERKFKCDQCPKTFKQRFLLNYHVNMHNGIKPFVCKFCGKAFHSSNILGTHKLRVHKEEMKKNK